MNLLYALAVGVMFGVGIRLFLSRDLVRVSVGTILIANAANVYLMSASLQAGRAPILPFAGQPSTDPVVQALVLTAIVISFGSTALLLAIVYGVFRTWGTTDVSELTREREEETHSGERGEDASS